ncbi:hypothetical protein MCAMS1_00467 [biofilm metagenome]
MVNSLMIFMAIFNRVLAPEGEILSFASPKESIQRKSDPLPLTPCASRFQRELIEGASLHLDKRDSSLNRPFRVNPIENCDARRGIRGLTNLLIICFILY